MGICVADITGVDIEYSSCRVERGLLKLCVYLGDLVFPACLHLLLVDLDSWNCDMPPISQEVRAQQVHISVFLAQL